jgi:hypothetical protein
VQPNFQRGKKTFGPNVLPNCGQLSVRQDWANFRHQQKKFNNFFGQGEIFIHFSAQS